MAKTTQAKLADAFKNLVSKTAEMRVNNHRVVNGSVECIGGWKLTLTLDNGNTLTIDDKALGRMTFEKGDFMLSEKDKDKKEQHYQIAFYTMKKEIPRHL